MRASYLRIDVIEQAIRLSRGAAVDLGAEGYLIAYALAGSNLALGRIVVADCVNPLPVTREAWREVARQANTRLLEVELVASDVAEHRRRVETRTADISGALLPTWADVTNRAYAPWPEPHLVIDTTRTPVDAAVTILRRAVGSPCIDAGRPASGDEDVDRTRNDMGAFGGPEGSGW